MQSIPLLTFAQLRIIDQWCDRFDQSWNEGIRPDIGFYLSQVVDELVGPLLDELLRMELEWRCRLGEDPPIEEYRASFPAYNNSIVQLLEEAKESASQFQSPDTRSHTGFQTSSTVVKESNKVPAKEQTSANDKQIGEYELLEKLGTGGMGEVYKARHRKLGKLVALKKLLGTRNDSPESVARFLREMKAIGQLEHPHLVEAIDAGQLNETVYLVMKLVEGTDLQKYVVQQGPLSIREVCLMGHQVALGLSYLHQKGLVHRDLKPSNIMRTQEGVAKILDLGLARFQRAAEEDPLTKPDQGMGTPDYMAPEQFLNASKVDIRADLYALGGTLYYLLTGNAPYAHRKTAFEKMRAQESEPLKNIQEVRPEVPVVLANLIHRLLEKRPARRPQTPDEVARVLESLLRPVHYRDSSTVTYQSITNSKRGVPKYAPALFSTLFLLLVVGVLLWQPWTSSSSITEYTKGKGDSSKILSAKTNSIEVVHFHIEHFEKRSKRSRYGGILGEKSFDPVLDDAVTIDIKLSHPAYGYILAFRPDGKSELCFPEDENVAPPLTDRPRYPFISRDLQYGFNEGIGLHVFAFVYSDTPLPSYKDWRHDQPAYPWKSETTPLGIVWVDDGNEVLTLSEDDPTGKRGARQPTEGKTPLVQLTDHLRKLPGIQKVYSIGFGIRPKK